MILSSLFILYSRGQRHSWGRVADYSAAELCGGCILESHVACTTQHLEAEPDEYDTHAIGACCRSCPSLYGRQPQWAFNRYRERSIRRERIARDWKCPLKRWGCGLCSWWAASPVLGGAAAVRKLGFRSVARSGPSWDDLKLEHSKRATLGPDKWLGGLHIAVTGALDNHYRHWKWYAGEHSGVWRWQPLWPGKGFRCETQPRPSLDWSPGHLDPKQHRLGDHTRRGCKGLWSRADANVWRIVAARVALLRSFRRPGYPLR